MSHFVAYILQFQEIIVYKIPPGGGRGSIASLRSNSYVFHKCISEKELDSNLEPMSFLFTFLTPLLQNRKLLSWIFGIDRGFIFLGRLHASNLKIIKVWGQK